jgi:hypothetical protein
LNAQCSGHHVAMESALGERTHGPRTNASMDTCDVRNALKKLEPRDTHGA